MWEWRRPRSRSEGSSATRDQAQPKLRLGIRPAVPTHPAAAVDYVLAQATALLSCARAARDGVEVQRLLQWIDARLDERLRLTRSPSP